MSLDLAYGPSLPETESPIFLAMTEISAATSPTEIIDSLRQYILPDADRLSLIQVDFGTAGEAVYRTIAAWDRDDLDIEDSPPAAIRELVGADPLVLPNVDETGKPLFEMRGLNTWGVVSMLRRLENKSGFPCNPHVFRRTFACLLRKSGLDVMTIKDLGRWESLEMVQRYTRTVTFRDSLKFYKTVVD